MENKDFSRFVENINTEDFIYEIERKPDIWDSGKEEYSNKIERRNAWQHVSSKFVADFEEKSTADKTLIVTSLQKKWKCIRTCYAREIQKKKEERSGSGAKGRKQYVYFECLRFLERLSKVKTSTMDQGDENDRGEIDNEVEETSGLDVRVAEEEERSNEARKRKRKSSKDDDDLIEILKRRTAQEMEEEKDEDRQFLLSLVSDMRKVPHEKKLKLKADIIMAIAEAQKQVVGVQTQRNPLSQRNFLQQGQYMYLRTGNPGSPLDGNVVELDYV